MPELNKDKCFKLTEDNTIAAPNSALLEADWLQRLGALCATALEIPEAQLIRQVESHAGNPSTYSLKKELVAGLQLIYIKLTDPNKPPLDKSEQAAIATKLQEGAGTCTQGFHDRVNDIISGFQTPNSLDALLTQIRKSIIETTARQSTDEVHAHNRFSIVASMAGYGIKPINWQDAYRGNLNDNEIKEKLDSAFKEKYIPLILLSELSEAIKGVMHAKFNYTGKKPEGYKGVNTFSAWVDYLKQLFDSPEWDPADQISMNKPYCLKIFSTHRY